MIVIDTNILIAALLKEGTTRKITIESALDFAYPEIALQEIIKYKNYILEKSRYTEREFETILNKLLEYITLVPLEIIKSKLKEAQAIMANIDVNDVVFIVTALTLDNATIWSDDRDFEKQQKIRILKTSELIARFQKA